MSLFITPADSIGVLKGGGQEAWAPAGNCVCVCVGGGGEAALKWPPRSTKKAPT